MRPRCPRAGWRQMWKISFIAMRKLRTYSACSRARFRWSAKRNPDRQGGEQVRDPNPSRDHVERLQRCSSLVIPLRRMHILEGQRLLIENRRLIFAGVLPRGHVAEIFIVAPSLAVRRLIFLSEMCTA